MAQQRQAWEFPVKVAGEDWVDEAARAVQATSASNLRADAGVDVKNLALAALGVGAAGRGAVGLYNMFKRSRPKKRVDPAMSLPYPVVVKEAGVLGRLFGGGAKATFRKAQPGEAAKLAQTPVSPSAPTASYRPAAGSTKVAGGSTAGGTANPDAGIEKLSPKLHAWLHGGPRTWSAAALAGAGGLGAYGTAKAASFVAGDAATTKAGIPWYGPAMMLAGLGGLGAGWKGVDHVLNKKRERDRKGELEAARMEFHDALIGQYDKPLAGTPPTKTAAEATMEKVGAALDGLYDAFEALMEKAATTPSDLAGQGLGMYGMYAGLTGLATGALVYDKARKRQRRAILEKAMQRRDRRKFNVAPPEITAVPEPFHPKPVGDPTEAIALNV